MTSIQFTQPNAGGPLASADVAGADPVANWNVAECGGDFASKPGGGGQVTVSSTSATVDSTGAPSSVRYTLASYGYASTGDCAVTGSDGVLLKGGAITTGTGGEAPMPVVVNLSGLDSGNAYKIIVYTIGGPSQLSYGSMALTGGPTYYFVTAEGNGVGGSLTALQNSSSTTDILKSTATGAPIDETLKSNYIEFDGVTGLSTATLTLTELGAWPNGAWTPSSADSSHVPLGIAGVQVIDMGKAGSPAPAK